MDANQVSFLAPIVVFSYFFSVLANKVDSLGGWAAVASDDMVQVVLGVIISTK